MLLCSSTEHASVEHNGVRNHMSGRCALAAVLSLYGEPRLRMECMHTRACFELLTGKCFQFTWNAAAAVTESCSSSMTWPNCLAPTRVCVRCAAPGHGMEELEGLDPHEAQRGAGQQPRCWIFAQPAAWQSVEHVGGAPPAVPDRKQGGCCSCYMDG